MMSRSRITLKARFQVVGFHQWKDAPPGNRRHLANTHRHLFHVQVEARVDGDNREVEFHNLLEEGRRALLNAYTFDAHHIFQFGGASCEMIAREVLAGMAGPEASAVEVWEDGECGARVEMGGGE